MGSLTEDPAFLATTFVVIDFEATTPAGHPAQPIEVAALALRYRQCAWVRAGISTSLIRPPAVLFQLIRAADEMPKFSDLAALVKAAGRTAKYNVPVQGQFF
jgi:hypothetical protein